MSNATYSSRTLSYPDTSTLGKFLSELWAATPLCIFLTGIRLALRGQSQR